MAQGAPGLTRQRLSSRGGRAGAAAVANLAGRLLSTLLVLVAIRIVSGHLDDDQLGLWVLVVTAQTLLAFGDLGIGNGLVNLVGESHARADATAAQRATSSAFAALVVVAIVLSLAFAVAYPFVDWGAFLNADGNAGREAGRAVAVLVGSLTIGLPLTIAGNVYVARQQGWVTGIAIGIGSIGAFVAVVLLAAADASTPVLAGAMLAGAPLAGLATSARLYWRESELRPRLRAVTRATVTLLLRRGALFFVLALAVTVAYQSDAIVLSRAEGADAVPVFTVAARLFLFAPMIVTLAVAPLWPAYREAVIRGDLQWVRRTLSRSMAAAALLATAASAVLLGGARPIVERLVPDGDAPSWGLLAALFGWAVVSAVSSALAAFLNGVGALRVQVKAAVLMAVANLALSLALVGPLEAVGPVLASLVTQTVLVLVPLLWLLRPVLRRRASGDELEGWVRRYGDVEVMA